MHRFVVICFSLFCILQDSRSDIPTTTPGFTFKDGLPQAPVQLQVFIDLLCPYSKAAYPALKKLGNTYHGKDFRLIFQILPLPFHRNAFIAAQSAVSIVNQVGSFSFIPWLETIYANQDKLSNDHTKDITPNQVINQLADWAITGFPSISRDDFILNMKPGSNMDEKTRQLFRYTLAHGISGTPKFYLNGVHFDSADSTWSFEDWFKIIDPLVKKNKELPIVQEFSMYHQIPDRRVFMNVPHGASPCTGEIACEFAEGKTMCCVPSTEVCIVQYGCKIHSVDSI